MRRLAPAATPVLIKHPAWPPGLNGVAKILNAMSGLLFINTMTDTFTPTNSFSTGTIVWELCRAAQRDGISPWVISSDSPHAPCDWKNLILVPAPRKPRGWFATKLNNQFLHHTGWVHPGQSQWCRRVAATIKRHRLQHLPMVLTNDIELAVYLRGQFPKAFILHQAQNQNGAKKIYHRTFAAAVDVACAVSDYCREWNEQYYGITAGRMHTWLNGVDNRTYHPAPAPPPGPPIVNFHSRLDWCKGADVLLKAGLIVAAKTRQFRIQLVGRRSNWQSPPDWFDRDVDSLCAQFVAAGVPVERTGWIERARLPNVLRQAHIHVTPSRWPEPFGLTTLEGMACGLATVASATGGSPEVVGDSGLLFENENPTALAEILTRLVCDEALRVRYGRLARERAEQLTWDKSWQRLKELIPDFRHAGAAPPSICRTMESTIGAAGR
jgi:glycosyltransferase involved in cell wall biosynthesis